MPAATFTHAVSTPASIETAWTALQSPDTWSNIGPVASVSNPVYQDDGTLSGFDWVADVGGKAYDGSAVTTSSTKPERFELTLDTSEIAGDVVTTLVEEGSGCLVTVQITFRTKGMLSAMFFPAIKTALASGFPQQIEDLVATV
ncbi:MAG: SRPBCC family protein [Acidimicrobiia bacterium]